MKEGMKYEDIFAMCKEDLQKCMKKIEKKAKNDKNFKKSLKDNPTEVLSNEGIKLQPGIRFQTVENEKEAKNIADNVIPFSLKEQKKGAIFPEDLSKVSGGAWYDIIQGGRETKEALVDTKNKIEKKFVSVYENLKKKWDLPD